MTNLAPNTGPDNLSDQCGTRTILIGSALVALITVAVRLADITHPAVFDEFFHILAANGFLETGTFNINDGTYTRGRLYTAILAVFIKMFGNSFFVYRLPSLIFGCMISVAVFIWLYKELGRRQAWIAATLMAFSPEMIYISQFTRFYSLQSLLFFIFAIVVYYNNAIFDKFSLNSRVGMILLAAFLLLASTHLQTITLIGLTGIFLWVFITYAIKFHTNKNTSAIIALYSATTVIAVTGLVFVLATKQGNMLLEQYTTPPHWMGTKNPGIFFYHYFYSETYPAFWFYLPLIILVGLIRNLRMAFFCAIIFCTAIAIHSFSGYKAPRYIFYVMPFFFILVSIAITCLYDYLSKTISALINMSPLNSITGIKIKYVCSILSVIIILFIAFMNPSYVGSIKSIISPGTLLSYYSNTADWSELKSTLTDLVDAETVIVSSEAPKSQYYLGTYDFELNQVAVLDENKIEFARNKRLGRPSFSTVESLKKIVSCNKKGILISESRRFMHAERIIPSDTRNYIIENFKNEKIKIPDVLVYTWYSDKDLTKPTDCSLAKKPK